MFMSAHAYICMKYLQKYKQEMLTQVASGKENYIWLSTKSGELLIVYSHNYQNLSHLNVLPNQKINVRGEKRKRKPIQSSTAHHPKEIITANSSCLKNTLEQGKNQRNQFISVTRLMFVSQYYDKFSPLKFSDQLYENFIFSRSSRSKRKYLVRESTFWNKYINILDIQQNCITTLQGSITFELVSGINNCLIYLFFLSNLISQLSYFPPSLCACLSLSQTHKHTQFQNSQR